MHVKICCIQNADEARIVKRAGADMIGLVGAMPSGPGPISDRDVANIAGDAPEGIETVLLSSETTAAALADHALRCGVDALQIVGAPEPGAHRALRAAAPSLRLLQVLHVEDESAIDAARAVEREVDAILLDSGRPSAAVPELGGTGRTHDWTISARLVASVKAPVFLAGGLKPDNVAEAIRAVRPHGVDICTGVRTNGALDPEKLDRFMTAVRSA